MTTTKQLHNKFAVAAELMRWPAGYDVGTVFLQKRHQGWAVVEIVNAAKGERDLTPVYSAGELGAWLDGIRWAKEHC
jgi:hypothetical protein